MLASVISRVKLIREKNKDTGDFLYKLPEREKMKLLKMLKEIQSGSKLNAYDDAVYGRSAIRLECGETENKNLCGRKRKLGLKGEVATRISKEKQDSKAKRRKVETKTKKPVVDKSNPNWRLKPNNNITVWRLDPLYESKEEIPFISSIANSRLAIRAVLTNDIKMLKTVVEDITNVHNPLVKQSLGNPMTALDHSLKMQNTAAISILTEPKIKKKRVNVPTCSLRSQNTGTYNYRQVISLSHHILLFSQHLFIELWESRKLEG